MAKQIGNLWGIFVDGVLLGCGTDSSIQMQSSDIDVSCKGTGDWGDIKTGKLSWNMSFSGIVATDDTYGYDQVEAAFISKAEPVVKYGRLDALIGSKYRMGTASIASVNRSDAMDSGSTYDVTFNGRGALTQGTN